MFIHLFAEIFGFLWTPRSPNPWSASYRAESDSAVCIMESDSAVCITPPSQKWKSSWYLVDLKGWTDGKFKKLGFTKPTICLWSLWSNVSSKSKVNSNKKTSVCLSEPERFRIIKRGRTTRATVPLRGRRISVDRCFRKCTFSMKPCRCSFNS